MSDGSRRSTSLLVTGCYRSGTTLLDKLLHAHPEICVGSQASPSFFFFAMDAFHRSLGVERRYPLGHLFGERAYGLEEALAFVEGLTLSETDLDRIFELLPTDDPQFASTRLSSCRGEVRSGSFLSVLGQLLACVARLYGQEGARILGDKEILCEQYLPLLGRRGHAGVIIIRDPRDVVASTHFQQRGRYTGDRRPVLSTIRQWRKSVALALELEGSDRFAWIRYEDLVRDAGATLNEVSERIGAGTYPEELLTSELRDQEGRIWEANTSFAMASRVQPSSVSSHERHVPDQVSAYVETLCLPEMRTLGYRPRLVDDFDPELVRAYADPFEATHRKFEPGYSSDPGRVRAEIARWAAFAEPPDSEAELRSLFISRRAWVALRSAAAKP